MKEKSDSGFLTTEILCQNCEHQWHIERDVRIWPKWIDRVGYRPLLCPKCGKWVAETGQLARWVEMAEGEEQPDFPYPPYNIENMLEGKPDIAAYTVLCDAIAECHRRLREKPAYGGESKSHSENPWALPTDDGLGETMVLYNPDDGGWIEP